jgi:hypothetical protein
MPTLQWLAHYHRLDCVLCRADIGEGGQCERSPTHPANAAVMQNTPAPRPARPAMDPVRSEPPSVSTQVVLFAQEGENTRRASNATHVFLGPSALAGTRQRVDGSSRRVSRRLRPCSEPMFFLGHRPWRVRANAWMGLADGCRGGSGPAQNPCFSWAIGPGGYAPTRGWV